MTMPRTGVYLFPFVLLSLVLGIFGGFVRLGWPVLPLSYATSAHGLLMTGGFMGSLIALERSIAMKKKAWLLVPALGVLSTPLTIFGFGALGLYALVMASVGLATIAYLQALEYRDVALWAILAGAVCWLIGNLVMAKTGLMPLATGWWTAFILLTIVGERLELGKFLPNPKWANYLLYGLLILFVSGALLPFHGYGHLLLGLTALSISLWLFKFDMARVLARKKGYHRYIGLGLWVGFGWLALFGAILCLLPNHPFYYDLFLHTFFLGFAFSMIWAHAPVILPMLLKLNQAVYHPVLWLGWGLFQFSLLGRVLSSLAGFPEVRKWFGVANGWLVMAMFLLMMGCLVHHYRKAGIRQVKH